MCVCKKQTKQKQTKLNDKIFVGGHEHQNHQSVLVHGDGYLQRVKYGREQVRRFLIQLRRLRLVSHSKQRQLLRLLDGLHMLGKWNHRRWRGHGYQRLQNGVNLKCIKVHRFWFLKFCWWWCRQLGRWFWEHQHLFYSVQQRLRFSMAGNWWVGRIWEGGENGSVCWGWFGGWVLWNVVD